jgi:hypothetical protein
MDNEYTVILLAYNSVILLMLGAYIPAALLAACLARHVDPQRFLVRLMGAGQEPEHPATPPASPVPASPVSSVATESTEEELNTAFVLPDSSESEAESDLTRTSHESDDEGVSPVPEFRPSPHPHAS